MKNREKYLFVLLISIILSFIVGRGYIFNNGIIYLSEQFEVYDIKNFLKGVYPLWNDKIQFPALLTLPKLYLYFPLIFISSLFDSYKLLQTLMLLLPYIISFISSFKLSEYITLNYINEKKP